MHPWQILAAGTVILLSACAMTMTARTAADYDHGSSAEAKFQTDAAGCAKEAEAHQKEFGYGEFDLLRGPYNRLYDACMRSHGYQLKPKP